MKKISLAILLMLTLILTNAGNTYAATNSQANPGLCPLIDVVTYPGQNCTPLQIIGESSGGTVVCGSGVGIAAPGSSATATFFVSGLSGYGYNCYGTSAGSGNIICTEDSSCQTMNRDTTCLASAYQSFSCAGCKTGYGDCNLDGLACEVQFNVTNYPTGANNNYLNCTTAQCDTNYYDCDASGAGAGNGCEQQDGVACTDTFGNPGTISCTANAGGSCSNGTANYNCTCNVSPISFLTGVNTSYGSATPLLQGTQSGPGLLMQLGTNTSTNLFSITNEGVIKLGSITPTDNTGLYNEGGVLKWFGNALLAGGLTDADNDTKVQVEESPDEDIIRFDAAGTENIMTIDATNGVIVDHDLSVTTGNDLSIGGIKVSDTGTSNTTSGAFLMGVFDEFTNFTATTVQGIFSEIDTLLTSGVTVNKSDILKVEFPGAVIYGDGTNNIIDLFVDPAPVEGMNCYDTKTGQTSLQDVNMSVQWGVKGDYQGNLSVDFYYKTDNTNVADNYVQLEAMYDTAGNPMTYTPASTTQYVNTSWNKQTITITGTPTITPGGNITLVFKLAQRYNTGSERAVLGELIFYYDGLQ